MSINSLYLTKQFDILYSYCSLNEYKRKSKEVMRIKNFLIAMVTMFFITVSIAQAQVQPQIEPDMFIKSLIVGADAISKVDPEIQEQIKLILVKQYFDLERIGKFILGRYWRGISIAEQNEFLDVFILTAVRTFSPIIDDVPFDSFEIMRVDKSDDPEAYVVVFSTVETEQGNIVKMRWRLVNHYGTYKIFDVAVEGISLVVTLRADYSSYIRRTGDINDLIKVLRERLER